MKPMAYSLKEYLSPCCYFVAISVAQKWRHHVKIIGGFCVNKYHWHWPDIWRQDLPQICNITHDSRKNATNLDNSYELPNFKISDNCKMIVQGDLTQCDKFKTNGEGNFEKSGFCSASSILSVFGFNKLKWQKNVKKKVKYKLKR